MAGLGLRLVDVLDAWPAGFGNFDCVHVAIMPGMSLARTSSIRAMAGWPQQPAGDGDDAGLVAAPAPPLLVGCRRSVAGLVIAATRDYPRGSTSFYCVAIC